MGALLLALALGASAVAGFPRDAGGKISNSAIAAPVGGAPAVIVAAGERVVAFRPDGGAAGLSIALGEGESAAGGPAAADMDGDGRPEIAVATASGKVFLWSGGVAPGFPVRLGAAVKGGASFGDVDGDGRPELLVGDVSGRLHALRKTGRELPGFPVALPGCLVTSTISSSAFGGGRSIAVGCEDGRVHVLDAHGRERAGFPLVTSFSVTGAPVFVDLDDDGAMDLVVASQDYGVYAVAEGGKALTGFPVRAGYRVYEAPAVADLDGDGRLDVVFASADGMLHAVTAAGAELPGFPARVGSRIFGGPALADLDGDGRLDVVVVTADGTLAAVSGRGRPLEGFPATLSATDENASPLVAAAGDGAAPAVFVGLPDGQLHALRAPGAAADGRIAWAGPGREPGRTGRYGPNPPSWRDLAVEPAAPRTLDRLRASWRTVWLDAGPGEAPPSPAIAWQRDGRAVAELAGKRELPPGTARRGERWRFVVEAPRGAVRSPEVAIADTPPSAPAVALDPAVPSRNADVRARIARPAEDPDGDPIRYEFGWLQDGLDTGVRGDTFPAARLRGGALLAVRVVATDGTLSGPPATAEARVGNTPPGAPRIALEPPAPAQGEPVRARIDVPAVDPDGDPIVYRYAWTVDGRRLNLPWSAAELPPGAFRKHQRIEVEVRAFDGRLAGPPSRAEATARNSVPTAPAVELVPARPRRGEPVRAVIRAPARDADGDALAYRFAWRKNGAPFQASADGREVPAAAVVRGDRFEVSAVATDGEATGPAGTASVTVANTPPVPPRIAIAPRRPAGGQPLRVVVLAPARDADGDRVALDVAWTRSGAPTGAGGETLAPTQFRKHEHVRVTVTPRDAEGAGPSAQDEVLVEDAPPGAPEIAFSSAHPTVAAPLRVLVRTPATDPDGDALRYEHRWSRDGEPVAFPDGTVESKAAPYWTRTSEVPAARLRKGQRWTVEVRAHDGERPGPAVRASVTIANTPPPAPRVALSPERPRRVDGIAAVVAQPPDADGDAVAYRYAWFRDGARTQLPADQAQLPRSFARKGERWAVEVTPNDGEEDGPAARAEVVVADTAPGPVAIALCDGPVPAGAVPEARIVTPATDADGDRVQYRYEWTVNDRPVPSASGQARLGAPPLRKHDRARVAVTPWDGELAGPVATAECEVTNTPPAAPLVALQPAEPSAARGVSAVIVKPATDRDGDPVAYRYLWWRDGVPFETVDPTIPPGTLKHGETWRVEVTPFDGEDAGEPVVLETVVANTPPPAPAVALAPPSAATGEAIRCEARAPGRDADGEAIAVKLRWLRDGQPEAIWDGSAALPAGVVRRGERWRCEARSSDGSDESAPAAAEVTVRNSPPTAPAVAIEPAAPRRGDDLFCRVAAPSRDADGDAVSYAYAWTEDGRALAPGGDPARVEGSRVVKGRRFRCAVTPSDGTAAGPAASVSATVLNTPPGPALVRIEPAAPIAGRPIRCVVAGESEDPDGDAVRYRYAWQRNGTAQPFATTSQEVPSRLVKAADRWRCTVTPTDGTDDGPTAGSEEVPVAPAAGERTVALP